MGLTDYRFALARYTTDGSLDTTFSGNGKLITDFATSSTEGANAMAIDGNGRIVVAGYAFGGGALARYKTDGDLDTSFGNGGKVITAFTNLAIAIDVSGRIVAAGTAFISDHDRFALARYTRNGIMDLTFGSGGMLTTNFTTGSSEAAYATAVAIDSTGRIVVAGSVASTAW